MKETLTAIGLFMFGFVAGGIVARKTCRILDSINTPKGDEGNSGRPETVEIRSDTVETATVETAKA